MLERGLRRGEEPYTLAIQCRLSVQLLGFLYELGTDVDARLLERARAARYPASSLKALPPAWRAQAFETRGRQFCLRDEYKDAVELERQDLGAELPRRQFDLILCRNLASLFRRRARAPRARGHRGPAAPRRCARGRSPRTPAAAGGGLRALAGLPRDLRLRAA